ncbi:MAG TPA: hypothetical protein VLC12_02315 [Terriglobales bacterium]|nr:hypothetical protein [Terriglobales bacterium]
MASKRDSSDDLKARLDEAFKNAGRKVEAASKKVGRSLQESGLDKDAEDIITYFNDEVVPAIRSHSTQALRTAAKKLAQFADYMDRKQRG